jgi:hypothetical protein
VGQRGGPHGRLREHALLPALTIMPIIATGSQSMAPVAAPGAWRAVDPNMGEAPDLCPGEMPQPRRRQLRVVVATPAEQGKGTLRVPTRCVHVHSASERPERT